MLDPSLQCARFIYDELMKVRNMLVSCILSLCMYFQINLEIVSVQISHRCLVNELQRFPVLRKRMDEVIGNFLREGLEPSETMIGHIIEMEV